MMLDSLLAKIRILFALMFLIGSTVFYFILNDFHQEEAHQLIQDKLLTTAAMQKYISKVQKPAIYKLIKEKKLSEDFFDPSLMSSTYIITRVQEIVKENHLTADKHIHESVDFKFASDNPTNPLNKANQFESEILKKFNNSDIKSYT